MRSSRDWCFDLARAGTDAAMAAKAFAPALKALELMGRELGMWRAEQTAGPTLAELISDDPLGLATPSGDRQEDGGGA